MTPDSVRQSKFDSTLETFGEWINPILVKETRQALKSRQFFVTFLFLLVASLLVSFGGVALAGPGLSYRSAGANFFVGYFVILAFAVFVIVPFGTYRSLAVEQEERTFELISITRLNPRQIVAGKLWSAAIQMLLYYSAIGPCMTFTLLLKGIDAPSILFVLVASALVSMGTSMFGLLLASLARRRGWHVFLSVSFIAVLLFVAFLSVVIATVLIQFIAPTLYLNEFWTGIATGVTIFFTYFAIAFQLSAAQLTFDADNRSTRIRVTLAVQFLLVLGWIGYWWFGYGHGDLENLVRISIPVAVHWFIVGSFLVAERPGLSQRIEREIPQGPFRRGLQALLLPGPGTGLAFLVVNLVCLVAMMGLGDATAPLLSRVTAATRTARYPTLFAITLASYVIIYCGLGRALIGLIRRRRVVPPLAGAAIIWTLASAGSLVPSFFAMILPGHQFQTYRIWQISDPISTLSELNRLTSINSLAFIPVGLAMLVLLLNLQAMTQEVGEICAARMRPRASQ